MSNLNTAKLAIQAEIAHAKKGMDYYASRVKALEQTLEELARVSEVSSQQTGVAARTGAKGSSAKGSSAARTSTPSAKGNGGKSGAKNGKSGTQPTKASHPAGSNGSTRQVAELPSTGKDYWPNLVGVQPRSAPEILAAAIHQLGFQPTRDQVKKLAQRQTFALNTLVKAGKIQDTGAGRERMFLKK